MREWFNRMWVTIYYYAHRKEILKELSEITSRIIPQENFWIDEKLPVADCAITYGAVTVCCTKNIDRAKCNAIADELANKYPGCVGQWKKGLCSKNLPDYRRIAQ